MEPLIQNMTTQNPNPTTRPCTQCKAQISINEMHKTCLKCRGKARARARAKKAAMVKVYHTNFDSEGNIVSRKVTGVNGMNIKDQKKTRDEVARKDAMVVDDANINGIGIDKGKGKAKDASDGDATTRVKVCSFSASSILHQSLSIHHLTISRNASTHQSPPQPPRQRNINPPPSSTAPSSAPFHPVPDPHPRLVPLPRMPLPLTLT